MESDDLSCDRDFAACKSRCLQMCLAMQNEIQKDVLSVTAKTICKNQDFSTKSTVFTHRKVGINCINHLLCDNISENIRINIP